MKKKKQFKKIVTYDREPEWGLFSLFLIGTIGLIIFFWLGSVEIPRLMIFIMGGFSLFMILMCIESFGRGKKVRYEEV